MTASASIAKLRLQKDSIEQKKLAELKEVAAELGLSTAEVKAYGSLTLKATWLEAVNHKIAELFGGNEVVHSLKNPTPEELEDSSTIILTEESMIAPDSNNFVETPVPPSSLPVEFPEPEPEENPKIQVNVCVQFAEGRNNWKSLYDQANSLGGVSGWCSGFGPDYQEENWVFTSLEKAQEFVAIAKSWDWVKTAKIDRAASESPIHIPFGDDDGDDDWKSCPKCDGFGLIGDNDDICPTCNGCGQINPNYKADLLSGGKSNFQVHRECCDEFGKLSPYEPCETCNGTGLVPDFNGDGDEICPDCEGTGYAAKIAIATSIDDSKTEVPTTLGTGEPLTNSLQVGSIDDLEASDFEKETIVEFFRSEGMPEQDIQELQSKPLSKLEASACLGFVECYKKSAEIAMRLYLVDWVNDLAGDAARCLNRADQMSILFTWKFISEVKVKLAHHFQLRPGEINCFITPDGYRVSVPTWTKEQILTPQETEFITANDPIVEMFGNGYLHALEHFKEQVTLQVEVS